jgi:hypothetical protein
MDALVDEKKSPCRDQGSVPCLDIEGSAKHFVVVSIPQHRTVFITNI